MKLDYNPNTGNWESGLPSDAYPPTIANAILFTAMSAGTCVALIEYSAFALTSNYNHTVASRQYPYVDGVVLEDGIVGSEASIANTRGVKYSFAQPILDSLSLDSDLYLSKFGIISLTIPTIENGDRWSVKIGRKVNKFDFIFDPEIPVDLLGSGPVILPEGATSLTEMLVLGEAMPVLTCFKINSDGSAYRVTAIDGSLPLIDGITLEAGGINSIVKVGRIRNLDYDTPLSFDTSQIYYLGNDGVVKTSREVDALYSCIVGRSTGNSKTFIFDPQFPIKLAN